MARPCNETVFFLVAFLLLLPVGVSCIQDPPHGGQVSLDKNEIGTESNLSTGDFELTRIDFNCTYYATFQSHNQKVIQNDNGIFLTYLVDYEDEAPWPGNWSLLRSIDGGKSFQTIYRSPTVGSKTACLETDEDNNILALCSDESDPKYPFLFFRFLAERNYTDPEISRIDFAASGKYAMAYDGTTGKAFVFNHYGKLFMMNATDGRYIRRRQVVDFSGDNATTQYPHLFMDETGVLHHAWTTQHKGEYLYWDIHYIYSPDRGETWHRADGKLLKTPIIPDDTGPATQIILPDEYEYHTWLSNMVVKNGKVHFAYLAQTPEPRQHYVRLDSETGVIDRRIQPSWSGGNISIRGLDGFFVTGPGSAPLYYISLVDWRYVGVLVSHDNGETWEDLGRSPELPHSIYSIGGFRQVTDDDFLIGSFTNQYGTRGDPYFFRVKVQEAGILLAEIIGASICLSIGWLLPWRRD